MTHFPTRPAAIAAAIVLAAPAPAWADDQDDQALMLAPLTVTAAKREQEQAKIDGTVSVRSAEDLAAAGVSTVAELEKVFPGLQIRPRGSNTYANVSIRGMTSSDFYSPAVQIYIDGVPQDATSLDQPLAGIERVELLRGPQGTLYGANAYGGVINIITATHDHLQGRLSGGLTNHGRQTRGQASAPLVPGQLYADIALGAEWRDGTIDDQTTHQTDTDDLVKRTGRARLRYAPTGGPLRATLSGERQSEHSHEEVVVTNPHERSASSAVFGSPRIDKTTDTVALNLAYDLGPGTVESISSYQRRVMERLAYTMNQPENQTSLAEELRYAFGKTAPLGGVVGAFFQHVDFDRHTDPYYGGYIGASDNQVKTTSTALFGEATYHLSPRVDITGGLRYSHDQAEIDLRRSAGLVSSYPALDFSHDASFDALTPKLALGWQLSPAHRLYAQLSQGYKPGGFNHTVTSAADATSYDPETSTNWEIGWHGQLADGRVQTNLAAYWITAKDKQIYVTVAPGSVFQSLRNMGDSRSVGVDFDVQARPGEDWIVSFGGQLGRSTFVDSSDPNSGADYSGNRLPYAPDYTLNASLRYIVPQTALPGALTLRAGGRYFSRSYFDAANTLVQGGYPLFDLAIDLALDNGVDLTLFADNVADRVYRTYSFDDGAGTIYSGIGDGRVIGLRGAVSF